MRDTTRHRPPIYHESSGATRTGRLSAARGADRMSAQGHCARSAYRAAILPPPFAS